MDPLRVPRHHPLSQDPPPGTIWRYTPTDAAALAADVQQVCGSGSFIARVLLMITQHGGSKNFQEITGQDGLTLGVGDFAGDDGVYDFFRAFAAHHPSEFAAFFGPACTRLLDRGWIEEHNGGGHGEDANNAGLIRHRWIREGLAQLLGEPRHWAFQLEHWRKGKVTPSWEAFQGCGFRYERTLAAMIGINNSYGAHGMRSKFLDPALRAARQQVAQVEAEHLVVRHMLDHYLAHEDDRPATAALRAHLDGAGPLPAEGLGHRGRRVRTLLEMFPPGVVVSELGDFSA